jgi:hypothetical protein
MGGASRSRALAGPNPVATNKCWASQENPLSWSLFSLTRISVMRTSSSNQLTPGRILSKITQDDSSTLKTILFPVRARPISLCLSQCGRVLRRRHLILMEHTVRKKVGDCPAHQVDASLNGVSVPGCVGEGSPRACPHQCKGWSRGVRYTGTRGPR